MRFSEQWLREFVDPDLDRGALTRQLTLAGLEVDAIEPVAPAYERVVVGHVTSVEPHPNADKLRVTRVDVGSEILQIVCGAANVAAGLNVPTALVGAVLPGDKAIGHAKLRGVESAGMLCSARELGLSDTSDGLLILPADAPIGASVRDYLGLNDCSIELGLTPNRGDCLSVLGVAREVAALNAMSLRHAATLAAVPQTDRTFAVTREAVAACPRYVGRVIEGIRRAATSPIWLQEKLRRCGVRSIDPVVDVTNYVLLELGQPMHAFDLDRLQDRIDVRMARPGEKLKLLDGNTIDLDAQTLVIADARAPVALAGIMGGADSAVGASTTNLFLESAFFAPSAIAGRARHFGLATDSSRRFERGVDPELPRRAIERATELLLALVGGKAGPVIESVTAGSLPQRAPITLRAARIERLLGHRFAADEVVQLLSRLGMAVTAVSQDAWHVTPPSYRFDIAIEADLIEELARLYGYARLPQCPPLADLQLPALPGAVVVEDRVRDLLVDRGYLEAITYSFVEPALQRRFVSDVDAVALTNPIAANMAEMRTSLWPGLIEALRHNLNRQQPRVRLFEVGNVYWRADGHYVEEKRVAGVMTGVLLPEQWAAPTRLADFFDAKGDVECLLGLTGAEAEIIFKPETHLALHPGQSAAITYGNGERLGYVGVLHPELQRALDIPQPVAMFELRIGAGFAARATRFQELSRFPIIRRDLALVVDETVSAQDIMETTRSAAGALVQELQLFDVYQGEGVDSGKKSIALRLTLQDTLRTLKDDDVEAVVHRVLEQLKQKLGAILRD